MAALLHRELVDAVCRDLVLSETAMPDDDLLERLASVGDCCAPDLRGTDDEPLAENWCRLLRMPLKRL